ncbi:MAG TPA: AAA family ATPase [Candidatus Solibacter sp.]|nr:AAA family ATPase [Candidatus Solibacter sp.]
MPDGVDRVAGADHTNAESTDEDEFSVPTGDPEQLLSVLFTDLVGSTELSGRIGDAESAELMEELNGLLARQFERFAGRVVKSTGDGFLVTFTSVRKSIACALAIQQAMAERNRRRAGQPLTIRIGINAGEVSIGRHDVHGSAVNAAARIVDKAEPGEVLVSETVKQLGGSTSGIEFSDRGRVRLKGFEDRWRVYRVCLTEDAASTAPVVPARTAFVGREQETAALTRRLELALGGQGGLVMIGGEPGVGKTRLSKELAAIAAKRGMRVLTGHCYETAGTPPYVPFVEILETSLVEAGAQGFRVALGEGAAEVARIMPELRRVFPDLPPPLQLPPEHERHYLLNSLTGIVTRAASRGPLLMIVEDLHWADEPTLLLVQNLAERLVDAPVLIVGTHRDSHVDIGEPLTRTLEALHRRRLVHRMALKGLDREGVRAMLVALAGQQFPEGLVESIFDETEGNAFFVEEVFRFLVENDRLYDQSGRFFDAIALGELDVPEGVRLVIGRRLENLNAEDRESLAAAALIGRWFSFKLLQEVADSDADTLLDGIDKAEAAGLLVPSTEAGQARFSFAHELIRQTLVTGLSPARRQRIHLRIADALERMHSDNIDNRVAEIAHHLASAGEAAEAERTAGYLVRAGDRALGAAAFEDALRLYEQAVAILPPDSPAGADARRQLGMAQRCLGRWDEAMASWELCLATYERLGDADAIGLLCRIAAIQLSWQARFRDALHLAAKGLAALGERSTPDRARLMCFTGGTMSLAGDAAQGEMMTTEGTRIATELNEPGAIAYAMYIRTVHLFASMRYPEAVAVGTAAEPLQLAIGNAWDLASLKAHIAQSQLGMAAFEDCEATADALAELAGRISHLGASMYAPRLRASIAFMRSGDISAWRRFAEADLDFMDRHDLPLIADCSTYLGLADFWAGSWDSALELMSTGVAGERPGAIGGNGAILAVYQAYAGDLHEALALVDTHAGRRPVHGALSGRGAWTELFCDVETLAVAGEHARAAELYPLLAEALASRVVIRPLDSRLIETLAGIAAASGEDWPAAATHFETAIRLAAELPARLEAADARRFYALMLETQGAQSSLEKARQLRAEARDIYLSMEMPRHAEMVAGP